MLVYGFVLLALSSAQSDLTAIFDYDPKAPLRAQEGAIEAVGDVRVIDLSYASPKGGRVPAYLVVPSGNGPFPAVVYAHMGGSDRTEFLSEAVDLARSGVVSVMIDAPYLRPDPPPALKDDRRTRAETDRDIYVTLVVDLRRAIDFLVSRPDVDGTRIGYVGHSLGAAWGGVLAGIDRRIKTFVFMAGTSDPGKVSGDDPYSKLMQSALGADPAALRHYESMVSKIAAHHFVGDAPPGSILFQFARFDLKVSKERAEEYLRVAGPSHEVRWYFTGHEFHDVRATQDRREWLAKKLEFH
jgi:dienelactone hydrolase